MLVGLEGVTFVSMGKKRLHRLVVKAISAVALSETGLAEALGYHKVSLSRIKSGQVAMPPERARDLASLLRKRGERLIAIADQLSVEAESMIGKD